MDFKFRLLAQKTDMLPYYSLIHQLNSNVTEARYIHLLDDMVARGYRMLIVMQNDTCVGLSGIWVTSKLYCGKYMEMDNVVVAETYRSQGIGKIMVDYLEALAHQEGCETMMLDAYLENEKAHAFYEREGFAKRGYHFLKKLERVGAA